MIRSVFSWGILVLLYTINVDDMLNVSVNLVSKVNWGPSV